MTTSTRKSPRLTPQKEKAKTAIDDVNVIVQPTATPAAAGEPSVDETRKSSSKKEKKEKKSSEKKSKKKSKKNKEDESEPMETTMMNPTTQSSTKLHRHRSRSEDKTKPTDDDNETEPIQDKSLSEATEKEEKPVGSSEPLETTVTETPQPSSSSSSAKRRRRSQSKDLSDETEPAIDSLGVDPIVESSTINSISSSKKKSKKEKKKDKGDHVDSASKKEKKEKRRSSSRERKNASTGNDDDELPLSTPIQQNRGAKNDVIPTPMDIASPQQQQQLSFMKVEESLLEMPSEKVTAIAKTTDTTTAASSIAKMTTANEENKPNDMDISHDDVDDDDDDEPMVPATPISKPPPTMDVLVHRVRYLQFRPSAILCMAVTPMITATTITPTSNNNNTNTSIATPFPTHQQQWLALSRQNGSVELRGVDEKLRVMAFVAGMRQKTVDCMTWVCGNPATAGAAGTVPCRSTLVGGSNDGTLFCVHFARGQLANIIPSGGGALFCLQSLCGLNCSVATGCRRLVAAGCEDGAVRIFQLQDNCGPDDFSNAPQIQLVSTIPSTGAAILSLAWRHFASSNGEAGRTILFAGVADGTIRRYDCHESASNSHPTENEWTGGQWKASHRMTVECYGRNTPTRVWKLLLLADGTVVSGDSLGHVQFWDGHTGTLMQGFDQNDCKADVLDLAISSDESKVFASGVDSRVVCIERTTMTHYRPKWILSHAQRPHTHDVKALAMCRRADRFGASATTNSAPGTSSAPEMDDVLCTGGVDTKICTYLVKKFQKVRPRNLYPWPSQSHISFATKPRILLMRREDKVDLYQLSSTPSEESHIDSLVIPEGNALVGSIEIKSLGNLVCSDISNSGQLVALSDHSTLLIFQILFTKLGDGSSLAEPKRVPLPESLRVPCLAVKFLSNDKLVATTTNGTLFVVEVKAEEDSSSIAARLLQKLHVKQDSFFPVHDVCVSSDQRWIVTMRNGIGAGIIQVFRRAADNDSYQHWWSLPALDASSSAIRFIESQESPTTLAVSCCNFALYLFDVQNKTLSPWSEANGFPVSQGLPLELRYRNDVPVRMTFNPTSPQKVLVGSFGAFALMNMEKKLPRNCRVFPERHVRGSSRKRRRTMSNDNEETEVSPIEDSKNCTICLRYNSMLHMDFIANNEMLVVEQPWLDVVAAFPAALERKVYGNL